MPPTKRKKEDLVPAEKVAGQTKLIFAKESKTTNAVSSDAFFLVYGQNRIRIFPNTDETYDILSRLF